MLSVAGGHFFIRVASINVYFQLLLLYWVGLAPLENVLKVAEST